MAINRGMQSFNEYVQGYVDLLNEGRGLPLAEVGIPPAIEIAADAPSVLIFSPHPDDEIIMGALPLRLMRQSGWRAVNVAVTQGSNKERQAARWAELQACCKAIGFELVQTAANGLEHINEAAAKAAGPEWQQAVSRIKAILEQFQPRVVLFPHYADWNTTHIGTHRLITEALRSIPGLKPYVCETEFWGPLPEPNFAVESSADEVGNLVAALTHHVGEVQRNPYHLCLPPWMIDNVRRAEVIAGQGQAAPAMQFATLMRLGRWDGNAIQPLNDKGTFLPLSDNPANLFPA